MAALKDPVIKTHEVYPDLGNATGSTIYVGPSLKRHDEIKQIMKRKLDEVATSKNII